MADELSGTVALVTGASKNIGKGIALEVGASGEYAIRPDLFVALSPRLVYSKTTRGLGDSLSALWRLDVNVGAGYRF